MGNKIHVKEQKMAKSLRSKWKRKMRAEKRVRYGEREDKRLVKMLEAAKELKEQDGSDLVMNPITNKNSNEEKETEAKTDENSMDTSVKPKFSTKSLKYEHGNYPKWMSSRRIQKMKKKNKKSAPTEKISKKSKRK